MSTIQESDLTTMSQRLNELIDAKAEILREIEVGEAALKTAREVYRRSLEEADEPGRITAAEKIQKFKARGFGEFVTRIDALIAAATALVEKLADAERRQVDKNTEEEEELRAAEKRLQTERGEASQLSAFNEKTGRLVAELQKVRKQLG